MAQGDDFIYGIQPISEALAAGRVLDKVWLAQGQHPSVQALKQALRYAGVPIQEVPIEKIEGNARGRAHQGVMAFVAQVVYTALEDLVASVFEQGQLPLLVLVDGVTDVRNIGAIARTAEALGAHALLVPSQGSARLGPDAMKASAGALNHLPVCRVDTAKKALATLQALGVRVAAITEKGKQALAELPAPEPLCLLLGDEAKGISPALMQQADYNAYIPMTGQVASLNVSVAAAIALYEVLRQRGAQKK